MANIVNIAVFSDPASPAPSMSLPPIPWFAGMTALQAMIIGESMNATNFAFRVEYRSIYGAQIDSIDGLADGDLPNHYWLLWIDGVEAIVGVSEAIVQEDLRKQSALIEWRYTDVTVGKPAALALKLQSL